MSSVSNFKANSAYVGLPQFDVIDIEIEEVAKSLQVYLARGSKLTGVSLNDIDCTVHTQPEGGRTPTLVDLINAGMLIFDGLIWLHADRPASHPLIVDQTKSAEDSPSMHEISRAVFYCYFFLITQARYPSRGSDDDRSNVAKFLRVVMGMQEDQSVYIKRICSFEPQKFNPSWVKFVKFANFGQEAMSRFGLGVAGYRLFNPFKLYSHRPNLEANLVKAYEFASAVAKSKPTWDVHPLTRNPAVLTSRGNLNKNLSNLMLECFTKEQLDEMVKSKILYSMPVREPNYMNYKTWAANDDISGTTEIFRQ